jgi:hypothetical protein
MLLCHAQCHPLACNRGAGDYRYWWFVGLDVILETQIEIWKALVATA